MAKIEPIKTQVTIDIDSQRLYYNTLEIQSQYDNPYFYYENNTPLYFSRTEFYKNIEGARYQAAAEERSWLASHPQSYAALLTPKQRENLMVELDRLESGE